MEIILCVGLFMIILLLIMILRLQSHQITKDNLRDQDNAIIQKIESENKHYYELMKIDIQHLYDTVVSLQNQKSQLQDARLNELMLQLDQNQKMLHKSVSDSLLIIHRTLNEGALQSEQKLENVRATVEQRLHYLQNENSKKLEEMRMTVDEKLQKTLEERISKSFTIVSERLEQVYKGLGEMQTLAIGVGDLKKVLSNVKTRGILGEIQLGAILEEILSNEQYDTNVVTKNGSNHYVEYAIKLPADDDRTVYLPIDSKFPGETYAQLVDAYEIGDTIQINQCAKALEIVIKQEAKDIRDKYISVPETTEFAIMFLPFEGLYAEVVKRGMVELLQREYKVNIAGPTTMAALLNSLQMGFKTLAIQRRSSEVWDVLGGIKAEFNKFGEVLEGTQARIEQASKELDKLVGVRTRQIQRKLKDVSEIHHKEETNIE